MKLKQLGLINWANLENRDYQFADINLISGSSGAGKTTLLDALQTALTAAAHNIVHYNPGQEEATQQSRSKETRSLASYILGCDDGKYARVNPSCGYILAVFRPELGEASHSFTALVGASARIDAAGNKRAAKLIDEIYAVIPELELGIDDLLVDNEGRKEIVLLENLATHLRNKYAECKLEAATTKEDYLRQLYGAFLGKKLAHKQEARNAARQIVKFMAYKPEANLDNFVRNAILEAKDMSEAIEQVQNMMKTIHNMEREAALIEQGVSHLSSSQKHVAKLSELQLAQQLSRYELETREAYRFRRLTRDENEKIAAFRKSLEQLHGDIESASREKRLLNESLRQIEARKQGISPLQEQERLQNEKRLIQSNLDSSSKELLNVNSVRHRFRKHIEALFQVTGSGDPWVPSDAFAWKAKIRELRDMDDWDDFQLSDCLTEESKTTELKVSAKSISVAYNEFVRNIKQVKNTIYKEVLNCGSELENRQKRQQRLSKEIAHMKEANRVAYRDDTERALKLIREHLPQANPQVICDHIEVIDEEWQAAIEAFMGENRFLLVVDEAFEIEALALAHQHGLRSSLVQGSKAMHDSGKRQLSPDSIYALTKFTHETVKAYFISAYGDVLQVNDADKLRSARRGLMIDGRASSAYKLFVARIKDDDLKLGQAARQRALQAKESQLRELNDEIQLSEIKKRSLDAWRTLLDDEPHIDLSSPLHKLVDAQKEIRHVEQQLDRLDLSEFKDLLKEINAKQTELDAIEKALQDHQRGLGAFEKDLEFSERKCRNHETNADKHDDNAEAEVLVLEKMSKYDPDFDLEATLENIESNLSHKQAVYEIDENIGRKQVAQLKGITDALTVFNAMNLQNITINFENIMDSAKAEEHFDVVQSFAVTTDVQRQVQIAKNRLENNILASHKKNLEEISRSFNKTFISHLCHTLYNNLELGEQQLNSLNSKLRHHVFGEEHYEFSYKWLPEFKEYWHFLKDAIGIEFDNDSGLFSEHALSDQSHNVFERIKQLLLSDDLEKSKKELKRITDYRNYRVYDIFKVLPNPENPEQEHKISLKSYGTGSGGQMETPSYVIRAAALASALKLDSSRSNLKTLMIDESFGKMDEARSKAILKYLNQTLGFQILFVIPSKASGPFHDVVDQVIEITKVEAGQKRGELHTRVHVSTTIMNKDRVAKLWEQEKVQIRNQASLFDFIHDDTLESSSRPAYRSIQ